MAEISRLGAIVLCVWFVAFGGWSSKSMVAADPPLPDCKPVLITLQGCLPFVTGQDTSPAEDCCTGVASVHQTNPACLCVLAQKDDTTALIPNYNISLSEELPTLCKIQGANIANCPALLGETNATSPGLPPAVAAAPIVSQHAGGAYSYRLTTSAKLRAFISGMVLVASALISYINY
ncbi:unnamed protein product [Calypogeia fissa]